MPLDPYFTSQKKAKPRKRSAYILMRKKMKQLRESAPKRKVPWSARDLDF